MKNVLLVSLLSVMSVPAVFAQDIEPIKTEVPSCMLAEATYPCVIQLKTPEQEVNEFRLENIAAEQEERQAKIPIPEIQFSVAMESNQFQSNLEYNSLIVNARAYVVTSNDEEFLVFGPALQYVGATIDNNVINKDESLIINGQLLGSARLYDQSTFKPGAHVTRKNFVETLGVAVYPTGDLTGHAFYEIDFFGAFKASVSAERLSAEATTVRLIPKEGTDERIKAGITLKF